MSTVNTNRSMSQAFGALFGTIATTASAVSTSVNAAGNLFEELEQRSASRLRTVGNEIFFAEEEKSAKQLIESSLRTSEFMLETARKLNANPDLAKTYATVMKNLEAKLAARRGVQTQSEEQSTSTS